MSKTRPRSSLTLRHVSTRQLLGGNYVMDDLLEEPLVFRLHFEDGALLQRERVLLPGSREELVEDFLASVLNLGV
jgi:hypothetical protein